MCIASIFVYALTFLGMLNAEYNPNVHEPIKKVTPLNLEITVSI